MSQDPTAIEVLNGTIMPQLTEIRDELKAIKVEIKGIRDDQDACNTRWLALEQHEAEARQAAEQREARKQGARDMIRELRRQGLIGEDTALHLEEGTDAPMVPRTVGPQPPQPPPTDEKPRGREIVAEAIADTLASVRESASYPKVFGVVLLVVGGPTTAALFAQPVQLWLYRALGLDAP